MLNPDRVNCAAAGRDLSLGIALQIADGYHRVCASYHLDENTDIPCRIADQPRHPRGQTTAGLHVSGRYPYSTLFAARSLACGPARFATLHGQPPVPDDSRV
jgi:hypothetical protein